MDDMFRQYYINLLNDFIINKVPNNEPTIIKIIDVGNFLIVKGTTSLYEPLDIFTITNEFREKYDIPEEIRLNTIDLIEYSSEKEYKFCDSSILTSVRYN